MKAKVKAFWDRQPCGANLTLQEREHMFPNELALIDFPSHRGEAVLDVGCGTGFEPINYASHGADTIGLDFSRNSLKVANERMKGLSWILADAEHLPFREGCFDFISSLGALHHTSDTEKAISEIHRVLKGDKQAIIMLYNQDSAKYQEMLENGQKMEDWDGGCPIVKCYSKSEMLALMEPFHVVYIKEFAEKYYVKVLKK